MYNLYQRYILFKLNAEFTFPLLAYCLPVHLVVETNSSDSGDVFHGMEIWKQTYQTAKQTTYMGEF